MWSWFCRNGNKIAAAASTLFLGTLVIGALVPTVMGTAAISGLFALGITAVAGISANVGYSDSLMMLNNPYNFKNKPFGTKVANTPDAAKTAKVIKAPNVATTSYWDKLSTGISNCFTYGVRFFSNSSSSYDRLNTQLRAWELQMDSEGEEREGILLELAKLNCRIEESSEHIQALLSKSSLNGSNSNNKADPLSQEDEEDMELSKLAKGVVEQNTQLVEMLNNYPRCTASRGNNYEVLKEHGNSSAEHHALVKQMASTFLKDADFLIREFNIREDKYEAMLSP